MKPSDHDVQQSGFVSLLPPQAKPTIRMIGSFNRSSEDKQQRTELAGRAETPYHPSRDPDHSRDLNYEPRGQSTFIPSGQEYRESTSERDRLVPRGANHVPRDVSSGDRRISRFVDNSRLDGGRPLLDEGSGSARPRRSRRSYGEEDEESKSNREERTSRKKKKSRSSPLEPVADVAALIPVFLPDFISVVKLAKALKVRPDAFMTKMQELGFEDMTLDHVLNHETAALIAMEYDFDPVVDRSEELDLYPQPLPQDVSILPPRPPIVTIMGHVDHGKTTLLDWLRHSSVVDSEFGGITQHIGAFSVPMPSGKMITFLDTPGHEAFLSMRQRGANVTDIVVLVVAADDSVKPQTVEAIKHAQAAGVPIIVAITKIDKPGANAQQVNLDLVRYGIETEEVGGDTQVVRVSAKAGTGMAELEEAISTLSEVQDHRAPVDGLVEGRLIEAVTTKEGGRVATVLITRGTLKVGDILVAGTTFTRVRKIRSDKGTELEEASPGLPVEIDNWRDQPVAGEMALQAPSESRAREAVSWRTVKAEKLELARDMEAINAARAAETQRREDEKRAAEQAADPKFTTARSTTDTNAAPAPAAEPKLKEAFFIVKGDVSGSVEAVSDSISALGNSEVRANVLRSGVGPPTEFDVEHAAVAQGAIIAFNAVPEPGVSNMAAREGVDILNHRVIYRLVEEVRERLAALLPPKVTVRVTGEAEVATVFDITVKGRKTEPVAGCRVRNGVVSKSAKTRVLRAGEVVFDGEFGTSFRRGALLARDLELLANVFVL